MIDLSGTKLPRIARVNSTLKFKSNKIFRMVQQKVCKSEMQMVPKVVEFSAPNGFLTESSFANTPEKSSENPRRKGETRFQLYLTSKSLAQSYKTIRR